MYDGKNCWHRHPLTINTNFAEFRRMSIQANGQTDSMTQMITWNTTLPTIVALTGSSSVMLNIKYYFVVRNFKGKYISLFCRFFSEINFKILIPTSTFPSTAKISFAKFSRNIFISFFLPNKDLFLCSLHTFVFVPWFNLFGWNWNCRFWSKREHKVTQVLMSFFSREVVLWKFGL